MSISIMFQLYGPQSAEEGFVDVTAEDVQYTFSSFVPTTYFISGDTKTELLIVRVVRGHGSSTIVSTYETDSISQEQGPYAVTVIVYVLPINLLSSIVHRIPRLLDNSVMNVATGDTITL